MTTFVGSDLWNKLRRPFVMSLADDYVEYSAVRNEVRERACNTCTLRRFPCNDIIYFEEEYPTMLTALYVPFSVALNMKSITLIVIDGSFMDTYGQGPAYNIVLDLKPPFLSNETIAKFSTANKPMDEILLECRSVPSELSSFPVPLRFQHDFAATTCSLDRLGTTYVRIEMLNPCVPLCWMGTQFRYSVLGELQINLDSMITGCNVYVEEWMMVRQDVPKVPKLRDCVPIVSTEAATDFQDPFSCSTDEEMQTIFRNNDYFQIIALPSIRLAEIIT